MSREAGAIHPRYNGHPISPLTGTADSRKLRVNGISLLRLGFAIRTCMGGNMRCMQVGADRPLPAASPIRMDHPICRHRHKQKSRPMGGSLHQLLMTESSLGPGRLNNSGRRLVIFLDPGIQQGVGPVSYTHLTLPTTPYV